MTVAECPIVTAADISWELPPALPPPVASPDDMVVDLVVEAQAYRLLAQQALHALHDLAERHRRLFLRWKGLDHENRTLRQRLRQRERS